MEIRCSKCLKVKDEKEFFRRERVWKNCNSCRERKNTLKSLKTGKDSIFLEDDSKRREAINEGLFYCSRCKKKKSKDNFALNNKTSYGISMYCRLCIREKGKIAKLKQAYNITKEEFDNILLSQESKCIICSRELESHSQNHSKVNSANVDHCHITGKIRGLLCNNCNRGIGLLQDNKEFILKAYNYLKENENSNK